MADFMNGLTVAAVLAGALALAVPVAAAQGGEDLQGEWSQVFLPGPGGELEPPPGGATASFVVSDKLAVRAKFGCNQFNTRLTVEGQDAAFSRTMSTKMGCSSELNEYEKRGSAAFRATKSYEVREGQIAFLDDAGQVVMQIAR